MDWISICKGGWHARRQRQGKAVVKGAYRCKQKIREKEHGGVARLDYGMQTKFSTSLVNKLFRINILGDH